ncbi:MAG: FRG domain-containing protein, partial [Chloroflexota bacterium]
MKLTEERVNTIQEALNLAKKYKSQGKYDIFRGQRQLWSIVPSIMRKSESERQNDILNLNRFATWIANSSDYNHMIDDKDRILSIAQHYHLPTYFVDFTYSPDIAAFFASDGEIQHGSEGCIFCASLSILESEFEDLRDHLQSDIPKIVEIDVNNLW